MELAEPDWPAEAPLACHLEQDDEPTGWASDPSTWIDEAPIWVDAYEL